jgi:hypothetical protein
MKLNIKRWRINIRLFKWKNPASFNDRCTHSAGEAAHPPITNKIAVDDIGRRADDLPPSIKRSEAQVVKVELYTDELLAEMMPEVTYQYWTYNGKVPAPFIRAREVDTVETTNPPLKNVQTTVIASGSSVMIEFIIDVAGKYLLVDHSLSRAVHKGALAELIIEDK